MAGRNRWNRNPDGPYDSVPVDPGPDDCCCSWLKPKPKTKTKDTNREGKGKEYSNGGNKNEWFVPNQQGTREIDPIDTAKNGTLKEKPVWTQDQENSHGIPGNMKPSPQNKKISSPGQDNKQEEIKKKGKNTGPNSTNVTKSKDGVYSSEEKQMSNIIPKQEDIDGSYGGTRPGSTKNIGNHGGTRSDPTKSSTFEQAGPWKDHIKNRQDDTLEDHHKAVHKPEYNHGIHRDKGNHGGKRSDPNKSSTFEYDRIKNRHEGILEDHHKAVHKPEYNHGIHRDTGPDLTKKESSSPEQAAGVQKREGKQKETKGINNNDEQFKDC